MLKQCLMRWTIIWYHVEGDPVFQSCRLMECSATIHVMKAAKIQYFNYFLISPNIYPFCISLSLHTPTSILTGRSSAESPQCCFSDTSITNDSVGKTFT